MLMRAGRLILRLVVQIKMNRRTLRTLSFAGLVRIRMGLDLGVFNCRQSY